MRLGREYGLILKVRHQPKDSGESLLFSVDMVRFRLISDSDVQIRLG